MLRLTSSPAFDLGMTPRDLQTEPQGYSDAIASSGIWRERESEERAQTPRSSALAYSKFALEICHRSVKSDEVGIVEFRDVNTQAMMNRDDEVEEIHRVDIQGLAQIRGGIEFLQIHFGRNVTEFFLQNSANVGLVHSFSGSCSSLPISARNSAPAWPSLTRWSAASVMVTTERGPMAPSTSQGRATTLPKPTSATWGG